MFTHKITTGYSTDEGTAQTVIGVYTGQTEVAFDGTVAATTDNVEADLAFVKANVKSLLLYSSQALSIKTNSSTAPGQTITLGAGQAIVWANDHVEANPITADVTKLFLSNDTANSATVKIRVLVT